MFSLFQTQKMIFIYFLFMGMGWVENHFLSKLVINHKKIKNIYGFKKMKVEKNKSFYNGACYPIGI
jgi:hypothetical protein